jgi:hypothetical protein
MTAPACWAVRAAAGDATLVFGVAAETESGAAQLALRRLSTFPEPWPSADFELTGEKTVLERLRHAPEPGQHTGP